MAQLIKSYPDTPHKNRIIYSGKIEDMKFHLDAIEKRIEREQLSKCGKVFTEFVRIDDNTLQTCIHNNFDTDDEETLDVNYSMF